MGRRSEIFELTTQLAAFRRLGGGKNSGEFAGKKKYTGGDEYTEGLFGVT